MKTVKVSKWKIDRWFENGGLLWADKYGKWHISVLTERLRWASVKKLAWYKEFRSQVEQGLFDEDKLKHVEIIKVKSMKPYEQKLLYHPLRHLSWML